MTFPAYWEYLRSKSSEFSQKTITMEVADLYKLMRHSYKKGYEEGQDDGRRTERCTKQWPTYGD